MERITERGYKEIGYEKYEKAVFLHESIENALEKLAEYEDLEEQGLLLHMPCKVGDTVFMVLSKYNECTIPYRFPYIDECKNCDFFGDEDYCDSYKEYYVAEVCLYNLYEIIRYMSAFGKTVFLTRKDAEQKLKELQKEGAGNEQIS